MLSLLTCASSGASCPIAPPPLPKFHISVNLGDGPRDVNAIFAYRGVWHAMHQANWTDWAHLVSTDLVRWTRLPSALSPNGDWDGTLTILDGKPIILYDCYNVADCRPPSVGAAAPSDPAIIGVARPADLNDPNLTHWKKDSLNPITILNGSTGEGPSNMWRGTDGRVNFVAAQRGGSPAVRYQSSDPSLHNWTVARPYPFYEAIGGGVAMFYPLPNSSRRMAASGEPTHLFGHVVPPSGHGTGTPWFALGTYNEDTGFKQVGSSVPIERSEMMVFGILGAVGGSATAASDRLLYLGWLVQREPLFAARHYQPVQHTQLAARGDLRWQSAGRKPRLRAGVTARGGPGFCGRDNSGPTGLAAGPRLALDNL